jgi:UrcA family protein
MSYRLLATIVAAALLSTAPHAVQAGGLEDRTGMRIKVPTADVNLDTDAGAKMLLRRIRVAAETLCGAPSDRWPLSATRAWEACVGATVDRAVGDLGNPRVIAMNAANRREPTLAAANR